MRGWGLALLSSLELVTSAPAPRLQRIGVAGEVTHVLHDLVVPRGSQLRVDGPLLFEGGATFRAEAGATVQAVPGATIVVARDARLDLQGTVFEPVILTCDAAVVSAGCWGGLIVLGNATINHGTATSAATPRSLGSNCREATVAGNVYGGCTDEDSSGVMRFVRVQYAFGGVQLLGVGRRTAIRDVQVHRALGSGLEVVGGTVSMREIALTTNAQFGLSWSGGWRGDVQTLVIQQDPTGFAGGIRGRNGRLASGDHDATPRSAPNLSNVTIVARGGAGNPYLASAPRAISLERGTAGRLNNLIVVEPSLAIDVDDGATCEQVFAGALRLSGVLLIFPGATTDPDVDVAPCTETNGDARLLELAGTVSVTDLAEGTRQLSGALDILLPDLRPMPGTRAFATPGVPPPFGAFFTFANYLGAIAPAAGRNDIPWYTGWTIGEMLPPPGLGVMRGVVLAVGRGGVPGALVRALPSGRSVIADDVGAFTITDVPAGPVEVVADGVTNCSAATSYGYVRTGMTSSTVALADCVAAPPRAQSLSVGDLHACARTAASVAYCWGRNGSGRLGDSTTIDRSSPVPVLSTLGARVAMSAGGSFSCALNAAASLACWGANSIGQVGVGTTASVRLVPSTVSGEWVQVTTGASHSCALARSGIASCWGDNGGGQLGDSTEISRSSPTLVKGAPRFVLLDAGDAHTCGIDVSAALWCWGDNAFGQMGDGTTTRRRAPVRATSSALAVQLSSGGLHSCALSSTASLQCWGANADGQLGDGTQTGRTTPVPVSAPGTRFVQLGAGFRHTCAVGASGQGWCWGANTSGRLGDGSVTTRLTPTPVAGATDYASVLAGASFSCGLTLTGQARCWGANIFGQLGDGTTTDRFVPVAVVNPGALGVP